MLKQLKQADIDAVIAACVAEQAAPGADADAGRSPGQHRLYELIESLSMEAQDELLALMWTGGPKNQSSFEENLELVQKTVEDNHAFHLAEQCAHLPTYLAEGLKKVGPQ
jgi:hypothetical protein